MFFLLISLLVYAVTTLDFARFANLVGREVEGDKVIGVAVGTDVGDVVGFEVIGAVEVGLCVTGDALGLLVAAKATGEAVGKGVGFAVGLEVIGAEDVGLLVTGDALGLLLGAEVVGTELFV